MNKGYSKRLKENKSDFDRKPLQELDFENRYNYNKRPIINRKQKNIRSNNRHIDIVRKNIINLKLYLT